jgi:hypothetical protein
MIGQQAFSFRSMKRLDKITGTRGRHNNLATGH